MKLLRRLRDWLRPVVPYLNILLVVGCYVVNEYHIQGFCQPVPWVWWVLGPSVTAFLVWPWLREVPALNYLLLWLMGALLPACVYCTLFAGPYYLGLALLTGFLLVPLLLWTPVFFGVQVLRRARASALLGARWVLAAGALPLLLAQGWAWGQCRQIAAAVATLPPSQRYQAQPLLRVVPRIYMAERLAGELFKYHNSPEMIFDGWRPPLHDPLLNICVWFGGGDPLMVGPKSAYGDYAEGNINTQAVFYHQLFPDEPVKVECVCAQTPDGERYRKWVPGKTDGWGDELLDHGASLE